MTILKRALPLDPFQSLPWPVYLPLPPHPDSTVALVLGAPDQPTLRALLDIPGPSLLLIATHSPPSTSQLLPLPPAVSVRTLRLLKPLDANFGAVRLVSLLERAELIARAWRTGSSAPPLIELVEDVHGEFASAPSAVSLQQQKKRFRLSASSSSLSSTMLRKSLSRHSGPSFDAVINIMPAPLDTASQKFLVKNAVLVTTLSQPYLASMAMLSPPRPLFAEKPTRPSSRSSNHSAASSTESVKSTSSTGSGFSRIFKRPSIWALAASASTSQIPLVASADSSPTAIPARTLSSSTLMNKSPVFLSQLGHDQKSHIIHVLPSQKYDPKLMENIEQFLISYSYSQAFKSVGTAVDASKPIPYLISTGLLSCPAPTPTSYPCSSMLSLILCGALDPLPLQQLAVDSKHPHPMKAWISSMQDMLIVSDGGTSAIQELAPAYFTSEKATSPIIPNAVQEGRNRSYSSSAVSPHPLQRSPLAGRSESATPPVSWRFSQGRQPSESEPELSAHHSPNRGAEKERSSKMSTSPPPSSTARLKKSLPPPPLSSPSRTPPRLGLPTPPDSDDGSMSNASAAASSTISGTSKASKRKSTFLGFGKWMIHKSPEKSPNKSPPSQLMPKRNLVPSSNTLLPAGTVT